MFLQDNLAILETQEEVHSVFFTPTNWDFSAGGSKCGFCAGYHFLKLSEKESEKIGIGWKTDTLAKYWQDLYKTETDYKFFDFFSGNQFHDEYEDRPEGNLYLKVAKAIAECGIHNFIISKDTNPQSNFSAVVFTHKTTGARFMFKDTVDLNMYNSATQLLKHFQTHYSNDVEVAYDFISSIKGQQ